jgi:hypothetical protein
MNNSGDHFDTLLGRAARQLVEQDPPHWLLAAVMSEIRGVDRRTRSSWVQWLWLAPAAAALIVTIALWNRLRHDITSDVETQTQVVSAPHESPAPSPPAAQVPLRRVRPSLRTTIPVAAAPEPLIPAIEVWELRIDSVRVAAINAEPLQVPVIQMSSIDTSFR